MNKKSIIIISSIVAVLIIVSIVLIILIKNKTKVKIEVYDFNFKLYKTVEIKDKKTAKQIEEMFNKASENKKEEIQNLGIRNEIKIFLNNGSYFVMQFNNKDYCYISNPNENMDMIAVMPDGLYDLVTNLVRD